VTKEVAANLAAVRDRIARAAERVGRDPSEITLVAVSKTKPFSAIQAALAAGQREFGENRLEELWEKVALAKDSDLTQIRWHMIGTIQSRKSRQAVGPFELLHSVDRIKIAQRLSRDSEAAQCVMSVLLEVNISGEETKHGFAAQTLVDLLPEIMALPGIRLCGLMTMAPFVEDKTLIRSHFRKLRELRDQLVTCYPEVDMGELSMGMTNDFEIAVEEGATIVRIGSAIFGARSYPSQ